MKQVDNLKKNSIKTFGLVAIIYSLVSAGAFGIEESISEGGPGVTILLLLIMPVIWGYPLSKIVSELSSLLPCEGGIYTWTRLTLGEFWGWIIGFWGAIGILMCEGEFCALISGYCIKFFNVGVEAEYAIKIIFIVVFTIVNLLGVSSLEKLEKVFTIIVIAAFLLVAIVGFINWNTNPIEPFYNPKNDLFHSIGDSLSIIIWMYCGYEGMSNLAGELENPLIIPKALKIVQPVIAILYILPTVAALASIGSWESWSIVGAENSVGYSDVLTTFIGPAAGVFFLIVAVVSNGSIFCSYIALGSRSFFVLSDNNMFPKLFSHVNKKGIPVKSIIIMSVLIAIICLFDFNTLIMLTVPLTLFIYMVMCVVVIKTRKEYSVKKRKELKFNVVSDKKIGFWISIVLVLSICCFALIVNGIVYFVIGIFDLLISAVLYVIFKWIFKGNYADNKKRYPLNKITKLGQGDLTNIGIYITITGVLSFIGAIALKIYEGEYGVDYYLETYETGLLSNFNDMIFVLLILGLVITFVGIVILLISRKVDRKAFKSSLQVCKEDLFNEVNKIYENKAQQIVLWDIKENNEHKDNKK